MEIEKPAKAEITIPAQLRAAGLRPTRQRNALAGLLFDGRERHVTAEQLHGEAVEASISVSLATVYNTLHQFTAAGLLREIIIDAGKTYFDTRVDNHSHFFNESTGELTNAPPQDFDALPDPPAGSRVSRIDTIFRVRNIREPAPGSP